MLSYTHLFMQSSPLTLISRMMDNNFHSMFSSDSSSFDPMFSSVSLQSLLTLNPSLFADYTAAGLPTLAFLTDDPPPQNMSEKNLLVPKNEHPYLPTEQVTTTELTSHHHPQPQPYNFFPKYQPPYFYDDDPAAFHRLPELRSAERHSPESSYTDQKRLRMDSLQNWSHPTGAMNSSSLEAPPLRGKAPSVIPQSNLARQRRQKLSEKTRCLQKLMPWDKKMDQATLLEEAYKYVKFLQAQFCVLQSMPSDTSYPFLVSHDGDPKFNGFHKNGSVFGDLERLNRNQVLQVLVNSPVAQTILYSQGFCVFSMEQLALLRKLSERRFLLQQMMMSDHASSKGFFN